MQMVYLRSNDEKTNRIIKPERFGEMGYQGKKYLGIWTFCMKWNEERAFRIDRILEIEEV